MKTNKNLVLLGMMGSGKSTIGYLLSKNLNLEFYDIDSIIEKQDGRKIAEIFNTEGEDFFRKLEEKTTLKILNSEKNIVALGGGAFINKNIRKTLNIDFHDENLFKKLNGAIKVANEQYYNYSIESIDTLRFLKYGIGGNYNWHTDIGRSETSNRKLTAIIQLSDENEYEGGDFEFGITDTTGDDLIKGNKKQGTLIIFPSFLSHRVTPITKGTRYSIITWMEGDTFV